jgi:hypothetical protein
VTTASEPLQPEETQGIPDESREESTNVGREASAEVEEHDPTPATPVEPLRHPNREGGKRKRSRIRSMSTSTIKTIIIHLIVVLTILNLLLLIKDKIKKIFLILIFYNIFLNILWFDLMV